MKIDLKQLAQLSAIVEAGSFQSAADRLGLSQPALSRNMKALEQRIGAPVFNRTGRRAVPTELGRRLARHGLAIRIAEEQASAYSQLAAAGVVGELRIGAAPIIAGKFLTEPLSLFIRDNPECVLDLRVGLVHELRSMLERGQIDLVIGPMRLAEQVTELEYTPITEDRIGILCRQDHPLLGSGIVSPAELEKQSWMAHSRGSILRQQTEDALMAMGLEQIRIVFETDSIRSALEIVSTTDIITTMPRKPTLPYLGDGLTFLDIDHPQFRRPIGAIRRAGTPFTPLETQIIEILRAR